MHGQNWKDLVVQGMLLITGYDIGTHKNPHHYQTYSYNLGNNPTIMAYNTNLGNISIIQQLRKYATPVFYIDSKENIRDSLTHSIPNFHPQPRNRAQNYSQLHTKYRHFPDTTLSYNGRHTTLSYDGRHTRDKFNTPQQNRKCSDGSLLRDVHLSSSLRWIHHKIDTPMRGLVTLPRNYLCRQTDRLTI